MHGLLGLYRDRIAIDTTQIDADASDGSDVGSDWEDEADWPAGVADRSGVTIHGVHRYKLEFDDEGWRAHYPRMEGEAEGAGDIDTALPQIPFGSAYEPLIRLTLEVYFSPAFCANPVTMSPTRTDWDCTQSRAWYFSCSFHNLMIEDERMILSRMLKRALRAWVDIGKDDDEESDGESTLEGAGREEDAEDLPDVPGGMPGGLSRQDARRKYVMKRRGYRGLVDSTDIADAVESLFRRRRYSDPSYVRDSSPPRTAFPATTVLASQLRQAVAVPKGCILWELAVRVFDAISPDSTLRFDAGIAAFFTGVWTEFVGELRRRWELGDVIPGVDVWFGCKRKDEDGENQEEVTHGIDLRYALLYQKLQMLNCCVLRKRQRGEITVKAAKKRREEGSSEGTRDERRHEGPTKSLEVHGQSTQTRTPSPTASDSSRVSVRKTAQSLLKPFVSTITDFTTGVANDYVPMSRSTRGSEKSTVSQPGGSTLVRLFDRLTGDDAASQNQWYSEPPASRAVPARSGTELRTPSYEGMSWTSDYSWEGLSRRESGAGASGIGSLEQDGKAGFRPGKATGRASKDAEPVAEESADERDASEDVFFDTMEDVGSRSHSRQGSDRQSKLLIGAALAGNRDAHGVQPIVSLSPDSPPSSLETLPRAPVRDLGTMAESFVQLGGDVGGSWKATLIPETKVGESEGRKRKVEMVTLLETGEDMWEPETQEPGYMTEDMIREQEEIFERLGTSDEAARTRARMQCAQLTSDMEAFKAANPNCILADFVRWHSPRDWIMSYDTLASHPISSRIGIIKKGLTRLAGKISSVAWADVGPGDVSGLYDIVEIVRVLEGHLGMAVSLARKLPGRYDLIERLLAATEIKVRDNEDREGVYGLFYNDNTFPPPNCREYVIEQWVKRSGPFGRKLKQRMYALLGEGEFRIVEEVAKDGEFW
ncbi:Rab3 GTPase-activating protein catalytic subunit [Rhizophlyctis rosea]|uniref:Rab3 GTPase-activating protein catalytic subunit n=1 Tax=Rhizophlyctis rosea TaxID=64517 RepID=A0AAD5SMC5_9FUNG|nr:Rab3 GTPase-activating protein catalytic subunit [Rhizophlyctis rosea]